jgi:coenzyme F420-reducing hydrogenase alpha subunit
VTDFDAAGSEDFSGQKVRLYPVTRIQGRADIEVLFTPHQKVREARFRALESRGFESLVRGLPALRAPQVLSRICGTCGLFHQLSSCMAIEAACGVEVPEEASALRELMGWLALTASHVMTMNFMVLPDFALPMSDAGVKNITGIYMVDQESVGRLTRTLTSVNDALRLLGGSQTRPPAIVPGGVSRLPGQDELEKASELIAGCEDDLRETIRLAEMLTRRESRMMETGSPLPGYYMASTRGGSPTLIGDEVTAAPFAGGDEVTMDMQGFLASIEERPVPWSYLVPLAVEDLEPALVGPLARVNLSFGEDTPQAHLECSRTTEQWGHPLDREYFFLVAIALEAIWGWEKARNLLADLPAEGGKPSAPVQLAQTDGFAVVESPRGTLAHIVSIDAAGLVEDYHVFSPLQFNHFSMNSHLSSVAAETVRGIDISDPAAARLQLAVRSFNPCVACGTH